MITKFIENYAKLIVSVPEDVTITKELIDDNFAEIIISVNSVDIGKLIGFLSSFNLGFFFLSLATIATIHFMQWYLDFLPRRW